MESEIDSMTTTVPLDYHLTHPWPPAPEGLFAFSLRLWYTDRRKVDLTRLKNLTSQELAWIGKTVAVEIARRETGGWPRK